MKKRDIILISLFLLISAAGMICSMLRPGGGNAYIYVEGKLYDVYALNRPQKIVITGKGKIENTVVIEDNCIYVEDATCPYRECVKSGRISRNGQSICCLPAQILIVVRSTEGTGYDAVTK